MFVFHKFVRAEKSNKTVIITENNCKEKMAQILSDPLTYIKVKRSLVPSQTQKNNCVVKHWFKEGFISESVFKHLGICKWCQCAKIYGFLKFHKDGQTPTINCQHREYSLPKNVHVHCFRFV